MKRVLLLVILFMFVLGTSSFAKEHYTGTPILGFQDIPWRANEETIKYNMENKGMKYEETKTINGIKNLHFKGTYGSNEATFVFKLYNDEMWEVGIYLQDIPNHKIINEWKNFKSLLSDKYGRVNEDFYFFKSPYYDGDGYETQAIKLGKGTAAAYWKRPDGNGDNAILTCEISEYLSLKVSYQHIELADVAIDAANKEKSKGL